MKVKDKLYKQCEAFVENRLQAIERTISEIQESLTTETKNSAGDKHETGRAMLQLEREKAGNQLAKIKKTQETLTKINSAKISSHIGLGSVVYTSNLNYFMAISAGALKVDNDIFYAISLNTPIDQLLFGKTIGDTINFGHQTFVIKNII